MLQTDLSPPISDDVYSYLLDDELLLFSERSRAIFRLNPSAALIWCCCEEGLSQQAITAELSQTFKLPVPEADAVISTTLSEWEELGLVGQRSKSSTPDSVEHTEKQSTTDTVRPDAMIYDYQYLKGRRYKLLETVIRIRFSESDMEPIAQSIFSHLAVSNDVPYDLSFDVYQDSDGCSLLCNGELVEQCVIKEELGPLLHAHAAGAAYSRNRHLIAIHAAAVSHGKGCVVLPAKAGNGKSTLTAAMIGSGFQYCTDELVFLKHKIHSIQAIPVGIALKPGSWQILKSFHPQLEDLPVYIRPDGKRVRYLLPEKQVLSNDSAQYYTIHSLVFPIYTPQITTGLCRISPADALCRLAEAGYDMEGGLDRERVAELVGWIGAISCYELRFNDLQEAVSRLAELLQ